MNVRFMIAIASLLLMSTVSYGYQINDNLSVSVTGYLNAVEATGDHFNTAKVGQTEVFLNTSNANGIRLSRAYLTVSGRANNEFSGKFTLDEAYSDPTASNGRGNVFVKYLYGIFIPVKNIEIRFGLTETPWIPYEESLWGYRFVSQTAPDYEGLMPSSDYGVAIVGSLFNKLIDYHIMGSNGEGYQSTQDNRGFAGSARISLNVKPMTLSVFGWDESMHNGIPDYNPKRAMAMLLYTNGLLRVAGEYMWADDHVTPSDLNFTKFDNGHGYSLWGVLRIPDAESLRIFARYLYMKPNNDHAYTPVSGIIQPDTDIGSVYGTSLLSNLTSKENDWTMFGVSYDLTSDMIIAVDYNLYAVKGFDLSKNKTTYNDSSVALNLQVGF